MNLDGFPALKRHGSAPTAFFDGVLTAEQVEQLTLSGTAREWAREGLLTTAWVPESCHGTQNLDSRQQRASMLLHTHPTALGLRPGSGRSSPTGVVLDPELSKRAQTAGLSELLRATQNPALSREVEKLLEQAPHRVTPEERVMELTALGLTYPDVRAYQDALAEEAGSGLLRVNVISREIAGLVRVVFLPEGIAHLRLVPNAEAFNEESQLEVLHFDPFIA